MAKKTVSRSVSLVAVMALFALVGMPRVVHGQVMSISVDDDPIARAPQGILSLQLEGSGQIWYRNVYLKQQAKPLDFPK
jgi:hypothetical protein